MKKRLIIWSFFSIILVGGLTVLGFLVKKQNLPYKNLEEELEKQAMALVGEKPTYFQSTNKLSLQDLENNNYKIEMKVNDDKCVDGYIIIDRKMGILSYKAYITCSKYTTHGYKK